MRRKFWKDIHQITKTGRSRRKECRGKEHGGHLVFFFFSSFYVLSYFASCITHMSFYNFEKLFNKENYKKKEKQGDCYGPGDSKNMG